MQPHDLIFRFRWTQVLAAIGGWIVVGACALILVALAHALVGQASGAELTGDRKLDSWLTRGTTDSANPGIYFANNTVMDCFDLTKFPPGAVITGNVFRNVGHYGFATHQTGKGSR